MMHLSPLFVITLWLFSSAVLAAEPEVRSLMATVLLVPSEMLPIRTGFLAEALCQL